MIVKTVSIVQIGSDYYLREDFSNGLPGPLGTTYKKLGNVLLIRAACLVLMALAFLQKAMVIRS